GLRVLAAAWKARIRQGPGGPCLRIYSDVYEATAENYGAFALTARGIAVGSPEVEACYRLVATVPYRVLRPYLSDLGARLVDGVRAPAPALDMIRTRRRPHRSRAGRAARLQRGDGRGAPRLAASDRPDRRTL